MAASNKNNTLGTRCTHSAHAARTRTRPNKGVIRLRRGALTCDLALSVALPPGALGRLGNFLS